MERKNAWKGYDEAKSAKVDALAKDYMDFLDNGKTERECVDTIVNQIDVYKRQDGSRFGNAGRDSRRAGVFWGNWQRF